MTIEVTFWGTRGSVPVSGQQYQRHGGSTTCLEICAGDAVDYDSLVIDCGTGLVDLGLHHPEKFGRSLVLQTHVHWDHIQGFPFFRPFFDGEASFDIWGVDRRGRPLREVYSSQMSEPTCPIGLDAVPAELEFERLGQSGERTVGDLDVRWREMEHPSGSTAYRFDLGDEAVVFSGDVEVRRGCTDELVEFAGGADVLVMDAQYFPSEYEEREGFGHSTCTDAVDVAARAGVGALFLTHHDPDHDDDALDRKLDIARAESDPDLRVDNARDRGRVRVADGSIERDLAPIGELETATDPVWRAD